MKNFVLRAADLLASSLDLDETLTNIAKVATEGVADWCAIDLLADDGSLRRTVIMHRDPERVRWAREFQREFGARIRDAHSLPRVFQTGEAVLTPQITDEVLEATVADPEAREIIRGLRLKAAITAPLVARGRVLGVLTLVSEEGGRSYDEDDLRLARDFGLRAGLAIDNAQLYRTAVQRGEWLRFLADATEILSASLEYDQTIERVANLMVPDMADLAVVYLLDEAGYLNRTAVAAIDNSLVEGVRNQPPVSMSAAEGALSAVIHTGTGRLTAEVTDHLLEEYARTPEHLAFLRTMRPTSSIMVPLIARNRVLGALNLTILGDRPRYTDESLQLAEEIGRHCAMAIDNATLYEEARQATRTKDQFLAMLSHEIKGPLTVIVGGIDLMARNPSLRTGQVGDQLVADLVEKSQQMRRAVTNLLDLARTDLQSELELAPVQLQEELPAIVEEFCSRYPDQKVVVQAEPGLQPAGAQTGLLRHVVQNLLTNAAKYGDPLRGIDVDARQDADVIEVRVRDYGPGLAREDLERIFEPFYRTPAARHSAAGTGIGLTVCRRVIQALGGTIRAENAADGPGLVVAFTLAPYTQGASGGTPLAATSATRDS